MAQDQEVSVRQSSSVLLKNWIDQHWSASSDKYKEPAASDETKLYLRQNLPQGLAVPQRPIRSVLSAALANIAGWDWPETWPELVPSLLQGSFEHFVISEISITSRILRISIKMEIEFVA